MKKIFVLLGGVLFFLLAGCQGMGVVVEEEPPGKSSTSPGYERGERGGGPPPWAPAHGYRAKHRYRYYPSSRVYYEPERSAYFYYRNGEWRVSVSLPSGIHIDADNYVTLEMDTDRPYEWDHNVREKYPPGQLKKMEKENKGRGRGPGW